MKIVIVNDHASIVGGAAKVAILSAIAFADRGFEVEFFAAVGPVAKELKATPKIHVTCLGGVAHNRDANRLRGAIRGLWDRRAAHAMKHLLSGCDPRKTVVHLHTYRDALTASVANEAIKRGFVTIYTAHEYTLGCPYGGFFDYRLNAICKLRGLSGACLVRKCNTSSYFKKLWFYAGQFVFTRIARIPKRLSHVVFISELNRRVLLPYLGRNVRQTIVTNVSDYEASTPSAMEPSAPFVFVGSLVPHKDPLTAVRAAKKIGAPIVLVGGGPLEEAVKQENPDAIVTGWVGSDEVEGYLQRARALVFPSIWYEAHPCVTMEAALSARAIIASDASAAVEQVGALGAGAIFKAGDVDALADNMRPYLDTAYAEGQGIATREGYFKLELSTDRYVKTLLDIYRSELEMKGYSPSAGSSTQSV